MISEKRNVPEFRFPEFRDSWLKGKLGDFTTWKSGGTPSKDVEEFWNGDIPWISASSMRGTKFFDSDLKVTEIGSKKGTKIAPKGSLLLLVRGSMLFNKIPVGIATRDVTFNQDVKAIIAETSTISEFLLQWFLHSEKTLLGIVGGTGIGAGKLDTKELQSLTYSFPSLPEQQKIAEFLTAVDKRIELLEQKKEKLEAYKKGVMQQIFSQKIRFKQDDGSEFPDWEEKKLGEVYEFRTTNSFSRDKLNYESGEFRNIHYGDIHTKLPTLVDLGKINLPFLNKDIEIRKTYIENQVEAGDLIIADASEDYADIGKTIEVINTSDQKVLSGLHTLHAKPKSHSFEIGFGGYLMKTSVVRNQVKKIAQGTKVLSISVTRMSELELLIPCLEEQQKIVKFLRSLDETTEKLICQINQTQTWKKGLLQKMFV